MKITPIKPAGTPSHTPLSEPVLSEWTQDAALPADAAIDAFPASEALLDKPIDRDAEKKAFADLLKFFADNPEDDTTIEALTLDEFATIPKSPTELPHD